MDLNFSYQEEERGQDQSKNFESSKIRKRQTQSCDRCKAKKRRCDGFNPCGKIILSSYLILLPITDRELPKG